MDMNVVVLVKQVPEIALIKVDETANKVVHPEGPGVVNPQDEYAVEEGLRIKEQTGGKCVVMSVGSERVESALRNCLALGVDEAYLLCDEKFDGSDQQAIARILAAGIKKLDGFDLILAGRQAVDSDASQVPAAVELKLPAVVSVIKEINEPRLPSLKGKMAAKKKQITRWSAADLGLDGNNIGANSGTSNVSVAPPPPRPKGEFIDGESPEEIADKLFDKLRDNQVL